MAKPQQALTILQVQARAASAAAALVSGAAIPMGAPADHSAAAGAYGAWGMAPGGFPPMAPPGAPVPQRLPKAIEFPAKDETRELIDRLSHFVAVEGGEFECVIKEREANNPKYSFVFESESSDHLYYRWKVLSLCNGDTVEAWNTAPIQLEVDGPTWTPPLCKNPPPPPRQGRDEEDEERADVSRGDFSRGDFSRGDARDDHERRRDRDDDRERRRDRDDDHERRRDRDDERERRRERDDERDDERERRRERDADERDSRRAVPERFRKQKAGMRELSEEESDELENLLRRMAVERSLIRECMGFCISRSDASVEIVETITESLTLDNTPVPKKMARLFLVSDILHNSSASVRNASSYRSHFQGSLPDIFMSLHKCYAKIESRMGLETMKEQLVKVLHIWQAWSLFPLSFVMKLERILLYGTPDADEARDAAARESAAKEGAGAARERASAAASSGAHADEHIDGEPMSANPSTPSAESTAAVASAEAKLRALSLRQLEAVCGANALTSAGSRAEMLERLLLVVRAGFALTIEQVAEEHAPEQATLAVPSRWTEDSDDEADGATAAGATAAGAPADAADDLDGEEIDGEAIVEAALAAQRRSKGISERGGVKHEERRGGENLKERDRRDRERAERRESRESHDARESRNNDVRSRRREPSRERSRERGRERSRERSRERGGRERRRSRSSSSRSSSESPRRQKRRR